jgi:ribosome-binding protein aMBF1 (putative translation factor)
MAKKIERLFRERRLSSKEAAHEQDLRRKIQAEFPPAATSGATSGRLSQALKDAIRSSDKSMYQIAQAAGVSQIVVSRFVSGERDIRMATADKLAEVLGLKVEQKS